jgi:CBS domain-containing protein
LGELTVREVPLLRTDQDVGSALEVMVPTRLPALPVVDASGGYKGIFGEREFIAALFPKYLGELGSARFVSKALDSLLERRADCRNDPVGRYMTTDHVELRSDYSDAQVAETFLHHRVLILPIVDHGRVLGVITRSDFFRVLVERFQELT